MVMIHRVFELSRHLWPLLLSLEAFLSFSDTLVVKNETSQHSGQWGGTAPIHFDRTRVMLD